MTERSSTPGGLCTRGTRVDPVRWEIYPVDKTEKEQQVRGKLSFFKREKMSLQFCMNINIVFSSLNVNVSNDKCTHLTKQEGQEKQRQLEKL